MFCLAGLGMGKEEGRQARSSCLPFIPLSGNPISLTEGG